MSSFVLSWDRLSSFFRSDLQVIGYYVRFVTENEIPPLCLILSEKAAQLVCFPFLNVDNSDAINCLVLPEIPLFLPVNTSDHSSLTFSVVNRYLLALILVWTEPRAGLYHAHHIIRKKIVLQGAVKKSLITARIRTGTEVLTEANRQLEQQLEEQAKEINEKLNEKDKEINEKDKEIKELKTQLAKRQCLEKR